MNNATYLDQIPRSKRAYFVKKEDGCRPGRGSDIQELFGVTRYFVMVRPVDRFGNRSDFFGTKTRLYRGPFFGDEGKKQAEELALYRNKMHHAPLFKSR